MEPVEIDYVRLAEVMERFYASCIQMNMHMPEYVVSMMVFIQKTF